MDITRLFHAVVEGAVNTVLDELRQQQGLRPLEAYERRPILRGFYGAMRGVGQAGRQGQSDPGWEVGLLPIANQVVTQPASMQQPIAFQHPVVSEQPIAPGQAIASRPIAHLPVTGQPIAQKSVAHPDFESLGSPSGVASDVAANAPADVTTNL